jgi:hypothetical protein
MEQRLQQNTLTNLNVQQISSSHRSCLWFFANDKEGDGRHHLHLMCWSVPPRAELTINCLLCLQIFSRAMSASVWESDRRCTNSFTVHRLSSCVYCSVTATGMSVWTDTARPLQCLAVNTLPLPNVCTHLATVRYGMARSSAASCSSAWHSNAFFCTDNCYFHGQTLFHFRDFLFRMRSLTQCWWHAKCCALLYIYLHLIVTSIKYSKYFQRCMRHFLCCHSLARKNTFAMSYGVSMGQQTWVIRQFPFDGPNKLL